MRVGREPALNALHAGLREGELALLHQPAADGTIRVAILVGIGKAHHGTILKDHAARALHLQEEGLDGVFHVQNFQALQEPLGLELTAGGVGHHRLTLRRLNEAAAQSVLAQFWVGAI